MAYSKKDTHVEEGLANLISQFEDKKKIRDLLTGYLSQIQNIEDAASGVIRILDKDSAVGKQLDLIGALVGEPRSGRTDANYLVAINARIALNNSEATRNEVINIAILVAGSPITVTVTEQYPAAFDMVIDGDIDPSLVKTTRMAAFISSARGEGIKGVLIFQVAGSFQYDGVGSVGFDDGKYAMALDA